MRFTVLASSSSGNCYLLESAKTRVLVEAGLNRKETFRRLVAMGIDPASINAAIVSHSHGDHASALGQIAKLVFDMRVYLTAGTAEQLKWPERNYTRFTPWEAFQIGDITVKPFLVPHDCEGDAVGFSFEADGVKVSTCTDLGFMPVDVIHQIADSDVLLLEFSYDLGMLEVNPYPAVLKRRIAGPLGHLSNETACSFLSDNLHPGPRTVIAAHISRESNDCELVELLGKQALEGKNVELLVFDPNRSEPLTVECGAPPGTRTQIHYGLSVADLPFS